MILFSIVLVPVIGAFILPLAGRMSVQLRNVLSLAFVLTSFILTTLLVPAVLKGQTITASIGSGSDFSLVFHADGLAVFMALVSAFISAVIVFYSFGYISHYENQSEYYLMVVLFFGAMMGLVFSGNLIFLYLFWEITAITSWRLIGFFRKKQYVLRADKAFLVTMFGSVLMLIGFISIYQQTGSFELTAIKETLKNNPLSNLAVALILVGILSKSATFPLHTWLPDAGVAPSPVTALLHAALLVKIGVYVFARLFVATFLINPNWHIVVVVIAAVSAIVSACAALIDTDLKRIIAYSTVSQIGFIFLGLGMGNEIGIAGALLYIMMHGLAKGGLFLCAGIVEQNTHIKDITRLGGLMKTMPVTAISFLFCAFSVMGIPPFGGFFSKYMVMAGAVGGGNPWIPLVFLVGAVLTIVYLFRVFNLVFLGDPQAAPVKEGSPVMVISVALLAILSLAGGLLVFGPANFVISSIQHLPGVIR